MAFFYFIFFLKFHVSLNTSIIADHSTGKKMAMVCPFVLTYADILIHQYHL